MLSAAGRLPSVFRRVGWIERADVFPEARRLGVERIHHDEIFELAQCAPDFHLLREGLQRIEALADVAVDLAMDHHLEGPDDVVHRQIELGQIVVSPVVFGRRGVAEHRLLEADEELAIVLPVAHLVGTQRLELPRAHVVVECLLLIFRHRQIAGHLVRQQPDVGKSLNVGVAAQRIHAAARNADVAKQKLNHRHRANVLRADRMLRPAESEKAGHRLVGRHVLAIRLQTKRYLSIGVPQIRLTTSRACTGRRAGA